MPDRPPRFQNAAAKAARPIRASASKRGYNRDWRNARAVYLAENPLCVLCLQEGTTTEATEVDHIVPHKGHQALFWDVRNWQALCKSHHSQKTAHEKKPW